MTWHEHRLWDFIWHPTCTVKVIHTFVITSYLEFCASFSYLIFGLSYSWKLLLNNNFHPKCLLRMTKKSLQLDWAGVTSGERTTSPTSSSDLPTARRKSKDTAFRKPITNIYVGAAGEKVYVIVSGRTWDDGLYNRRWIFFAIASVSFTPN